MGGIFYDDLSSEEAGFDVLSFTQDVGRGMLPSWLPIAEAKRSLPFTEEQRQWQVGLQQVHAAGAAACSQSS